MEIKLFYDEKHEIVVDVNGEVAHSGELGIFLTFAKNDKIKEKLGEEKPSVAILGEKDAKIEKVKNDFDKAFDQIYGA